MKWTGILCAAGVTLSTAAFAQVTISGNVPQSGSTTGSTVTVSAVASSPNGISGWDVYFGNTLYYRSYEGFNGILDVTVAAPTGANQKVTVTAFDNTGADNSYVATDVTVNTSPLPTPPSDATEFPNLQNVSGNPGTWQACTGTCTGAKSGPTGTNSLTFGNSPSLSGGSMKQTATGETGGYWDVLYYRHLGCTTLPGGVCSGISNVLEDMWFYVPSTTTQLQALEFDPDLYDGSDEEFMSHQCRVAGDGAGYWYLWNMAANTWEPTTYACSMSTNTWHHFQVYGTIDQSTHSYTYEDFVFDGKTVYQNLGTTYNGKAYSSSPDLNIQQQIDNNSDPTGSNAVNYDNYNLWVW
jgi:hypothetical protein